MSQTGSLVVYVSTSRAQIPIPGATVVVSSMKEDGRYELLAVRMTDSSGHTEPITLAAPDYALSQEPNLTVPFASYIMLVEHPDYRMTVFEGLQVFSGVETVQNVTLIPLSEPEANGSNDAEMTVVTPQEL